MVLTYTRDMTNSERERQVDNEKMQEDSVVNGEQTEVIVKKGGMSFEEEFKIDKVFLEKRDSIFLATAGLFQLYEKYYTINQLEFIKPKQPEESEQESAAKEQKIPGLMIVDALKKKNNNLALYQGFLLITLTKNLKIQYSNLDQLLMIRESDKKKKCAPMTVYEKLYGQQSFLLCSKMIIVDAKITKFLQCLAEFKINFVQSCLNQVFEKDLVMQTLLGHRGKKR